MFLAFKELLHQKKKFSLMIVLVALITYLAYFLTALAYGLASSYTNGMSKIEADYVILNSEANDNMMMSMLSDETYDKVNASNKAKLGLFPAVILNSSSEDALKTKEDAYILGIEDINFFIPNMDLDQLLPNQVIVDESLKKSGYDIGHQITLSSSHVLWEIIGFTSKATYQTAPIVYVSLETWQNYRFNNTDVDMFNAVLVKGTYTLESTVLTSYTMSQYYHTLPGYTAQVLTFSMMIGFLIVIIAFVLGIFIYVLTIQKTSMFGVMKAEGISSGYIGRSVIWQTVLIVLFGTVVGFILTLLSGYFLSGKVPFAVNPLFFIGISLACFIFPILGGLFSVSTIVKIDPVSAIG